MLLRKDKQSRDIEFAYFYFDSTTKTVINFKYELNKPFQGILCRIDNGIYEGSRWVIEIVEAEYVNISVYSPLLGSTYIKLSSKLKNSINGLFNIKTMTKYSFLCVILDI